MRHLILTEIYFNRYVINEIIHDIRFCTKIIKHVTVNTTGGEGSGSGGGINGSKKRAAFPIETVYTIAAAIGVAIGAWVVVGVGRSAVDAKTVLIGVTVSAGVGYGLRAIETVTVEINM